MVETGEIRKRVLAGEAYDVIMVPREAADEFEKAGKIVPGSAMALTRDQFRARGAGGRPAARHLHAGGLEAHAAARPRPC